MTDATLALLINNSARLAFVQGEDRSVLLKLYNSDTQSSLDLTNCELVFAYAATLGGVIKKRSGPVVLDFSTATTLNGLSVFTLPSHGFIAGQQLTLQAATGATLPTPFVSGAQYTVAFQTANAFGLVDSTGANVAFAYAAQSPAQLLSNDLTIASPQLGQANLILNKSATAAASTGLGQNYQLTIVDPTGAYRIIVGDSQLDVQAQPCP